MQTGDTVRVRTNGRRAVIVVALSNDRYEVEFLPDPSVDPIDRYTIENTDAGGIYRAQDLEPIV
ncbi:MAG: hypothetical protein IT305_22515 [Chloroflexi bacterium]|nr:hypothetical protein [Chloroflexota bacterium]